MTSSPRASSSAKTTKHSMADGRGEVDEREIIKPPLRSSVWKHFGFCKDGDFLNKSLAVCRICKGQVKYNGNTTNAMKWWRSQEKELPVLSTLAKRYLCIPGTSVPAERVFSTAGDIVKAQRSVLRPDHVDQLIFLKKNL